MLSRIAGVGALVAACHAQTGTIQDVEHIVIFMQENRPGAMYYGTLRGYRGFGDRALPPLPNGRPLLYQPTQAGNNADYMLPFHIDSNRTSGFCVDAPAMDYITDIGMWNDGRMDSWNTARDAGFGMGYFNRSDLPYYYALADAFTIGDQYFQATFTQTNPNRLHLFSGSNGLSVGKSPVLNNDEPNPGFTWETFAETLEAAGVSWRVYQQEDNFDDNGFAWFESFMTASPGDPLWDKGMYRSQDIVQQFAADVANGSLPSVSWIIAPTALSEHASNHPAAGEDLSARILAVLAANATLYAKTAFILNYDEGGQFVDVQPPPAPPLSVTDGVSNIDTSGDVFMSLPIGPGFRVPLLIISPWTRGGYVVSEVFDHTSVIRFVENRFGVSCPNISPWRRAVMGDLTSAFDFAHPDYSWPTLPDTSEYVAEAQASCSLPPPVIPSVQTMPVQEPGTRPSRALPYEFLVADTALPGRGIFITIASATSAGVAMQLYNHTGATAPRKYGVAGNTGINDTLPCAADGSYALSLHGPNGFVRYLEGNVAVLAPASTAVPSLAVFYAPAQGKLVLQLTNAGAAAVTFNVSDNAYGTGATTQSVPANNAINVSMSIAASGMWYDFNITTTVASTAWVRRVMGRMETGAPSTSDPATIDTAFLASRMPKGDQLPLLPPHLTHVPRNAHLRTGDAAHKDVFAALIVDATSATTATAATV